MNINPLKQRRAGVLLHPTSLPSGKLDQDVERWLDWMQQCGLSIWQILPLVIPDHTGSPYQSCSAFALNPDLLGTYPDKNETNQAGLLSFINKQAYWLQDFALFMALKSHFNQQPWHTWPEEFRSRKSTALQNFQDKMESLIDDIIWQQFVLHQRWQNIQQTAKQKGIYLFGDMPIFVAYESADVWANQEQFLLDDTLQPTYVAGVPPDYFSQTGQRWGNPHYDWQHMQQDNFSWWHSRIRHLLERFDIIRIDHFRGLQASWMISAECETAVDGFWQEVPGDAFLDSLENVIADLPIVAEDLGVITPEVTALRTKYHLPGMSVLQFAFDAFDDNPHKPKNIHADRVVYTGTHDNNTTTGWFNELKDHEKNFVFEVLQIPPRNDIANCLVETALYSRANTAILPMQDFLQLGSEARMNTPGVSENNWHWQFQWDQIDDANCKTLNQHIVKSGRLNAA